MCFPPPIPWLTMVAQDFNSSTCETGKQISEFQAGETTVWIPGQPGLCSDAILKINTEINTN